MPSWKVKGRGWRVRFQLNGEIHYPKPDQGGFFPTRAAARAAEEEEKKRLRQEQKQQNQTPSGFVQLSEEYLEYWRLRSEGDRQAKTLKEKIFVHKSFLAQLGRDLPLADITNLVIEKYLKTRPSKSNWNKHRKNLCAFLTWCFKRGCIPP